MATVDGQFVDLASRCIRLHYRDWGGQGPPLLLLHGLSSNSRIWDLTAPLLTSTYRVLALDLRGHGLSDVPEDGYGFPDVTADVIAFLDTLDLDSVAIAGHSWGASVALHLAMDRPELVTRLVMVDGGFIEMSDRWPWDEAERAMRPPEIDGVPVDTFIGFMRRWPQFSDNWSEDLADMVLSNFEVRDDKIYRRLPIPNHMKIARALYNFRAAELLRDLSCPALAISCHREPTTSAERQWQDHRSQGLARLKVMAPSVPVLTMEDTIHDVPIQRPVELARAISAFVREPG